MSNTLKKILQFLFSTLVLVGSLYFALRGINFDELIDALLSANYWWIAATLPVVALSHFLRAFRWKTLLGPIKRDVSVINAFSAVMMGYLLNNLIPRAGELIRPYLFSKRENLKMSTTLATVFVERVIDVLSLLVLSFITFLFFRDELTTVFPELTEQAVNALVIPFALILGGTVLLLKTTLLQKLLEFTVRRFSQSLYDKIMKQLAAFIQGFAILSSPGRYARIFVETVVLWSLYVLPLYLVVLSLDLHDYYAFGLIDANVLCVIASMGIAVAVTPGAVGIYHLFLTTAMESLYGLPTEKAFAYAVLAHAVGYFANLLLGGIFLYRENALGFSWKNIRQSTDDAVATP